MPPKAPAAVDRNALLSQKAAELGRSRQAGWDLAAQRAFYAEIGPAEADTVEKEHQGRFETSNGAPITRHNGVKVCLAHVNDEGNGQFAFVRPTSID